MKNEPDDELMNMKQVAYMCGRSVSAVKMWVHNKTIPYDQIIPHGEVLIWKSDAKRMQSLCLGRKKVSKWSKYV